MPDPREEARLPFLSEAGEWLVFVQHGTKWYAQTPSGEYAFGDAQGLYEWRRPHPEAYAERIDHTGGDRVGAIDGHLLVAGPGGGGGPKARGFAEALARTRLN